MSGSQLTAKIDGKVITAEELASWKKGRIHDVVKKLGLREIPDGDAEAMMDDLTEQKLRLSYDEVYHRLEKMIRKCNTMTKAAVMLSGKKRKYARVTIEVPGVSAEHAMHEYEKTQLVNSREHLAVNLRACPDHYYLRATSATDLEVIETCGNNSVPAQFLSSTAMKTDLLQKEIRRLYASQLASLFSGTVRCRAVSAISLRTQRQGVSQTYV